ncbi:hypothetical protein VTO73DRAFT_11330 [Trametes versicolor]
MEWPSLSMGCRRVYAPTWDTALRPSATIPSHDAPFSYSLRFQPGTSAEWGLPRLYLSALNASTGSNAGVNAARSHFRKYALISAP